jgi:hypothetical protein
MTSRTISYDPRLESYKEFFDPKWGEEFLDLLDHTKLNNAGLDLVRNWHGVSNARSLPWLMMHCLDASTVQGFEEAEPLDTYKVRFIRDHLINHLRKRGVNLRPMVFKQLQDALVELDEHADKALTTARSTVIQNRPDHWEEFLQVNSFFPTCLWALERICFCALYYNYECFLTECVRVKRGEPGYRILRHDDFKNDFRDAFGAPIQQACWSDQPVVIARMTRHALVHNGGRMTRDLEKQPHSFLVNDGEIQFGAPHTNGLFNLLKDKALTLAKVADAMVDLR